MAKITQSAQKTMILEAEAAYPDECCGFLLGKIEEDGEKSAVEALPVQNTREDGEKYHRFKIESADFMRSEREAARRGIAVTGIYHSHPDHPAAPSDYDTAHALPFYAYIIVNVNKGKAGDMTAFILKDDRSAWEAEPLTIVPD